MASVNYGISSSSAAAAHSILLPFIQALGFGATPTKLTATPSACHAAAPIRTCPTVSLPPASHVHAYLALRLYFRVHLVALCARSPSFPAADSASSCASPLLLLRRKHDPIDAEVMFVAHRLYTYPLEKSEVSDAAIVVERN
ncbi:hypothetical protein C8J57DRAFT_1531923 [Mycena rebaudengoi]|nr:hypothetical protein C8J57DRAFT_1531923 [Mycena rebaudengoi]